VVEAYDVLVDRLIEHLGVNPDRIRPEATFNDLGLDSLAMVELAVVVREVHGVRMLDIGAQATLAETAAELDKLRVTSGAANCEGT
jgi:acyl carrier protein